MRRETKAEREAWTAMIEGRDVVAGNKYNAEKTGAYHSKKEAAVAVDLHALASAGHITELREQVSYTLVHGQGKIRPIKYIADFVYVDGNETVVADVKGDTKNKVYRLKKKLMFLLHGIEIREL